ncbi:MAG: PQQ-binding-like beta-propeller repeat protein [Candidatus Hydrogenedentes bacterium]|nr:PQQ-binding-like beta-propeller repeat protein [Candidatus Hydrogenedentota bacterium]
MVSVLVAFVFSAAAADEDAVPPVSAFRLAREFAVSPFGGVPFAIDLDGDGAAEVVWLQSPGMFGSDVFQCPPYEGRFSEAERKLFCLTATDAAGKLLWQVGEPWDGDRPFVTHSAERAVDAADIDGDGRLEIICARGMKLFIVDAASGMLKTTLKTPADNAQIVRVARTGPGPRDWTLLVKNTEKSYPPYEYANPAWFYDSELHLIKTAEYLGTGHTPSVGDFDGDGFDEFILGFNLVDHDLTTVWSYSPVPKDEWNAGEMHVDDSVVGELGGRPCVVYAASDVAYALDARTGELLWKRQGTHPQHCQIGRFSAEHPGNTVFVHNKRAELQLFDPEGNEIWRMMPPENYPLGAAEPCKRQKLHVFDATTQLPGAGPDGTDLLVFTDGGWPYAINGRGERCLEFPHTPNTAQDWGEVPGRPDDYGYGFYARAADFDGDGQQEVLISDRRFAWLYEMER